MNHIEFMPYHNYHIQFTLKNGTIKRGVVIDNLDFDEKSTSTEYVFVREERMKEWKAAEARKDNSKMKRIQKSIDIRDIKSASRIK